MREYKFRYRIRDRKTGGIVLFTASISDIELKAFSPNPFNWLDYELLSRDLSTDLHDKNGKEVFERDVVKHHYKEDGPNLRDKITIEIGKVVFSQGSFWSEFIPPYNWDPMALATLLTSGEMEVIGNVYENPELLANTQASL